MGNAYHIPKVGGQSVLNPMDVAAGCQQSGLPADFIGLASSLTLPIGMEPGSAWFLLSSQAIGSLNLNGPLNIEWEYNENVSPGVPGTTLTFPNWYASGSRAVTSNVTNAAVWLLHLLDRRSVLSHAATADKSYNIPRPRYSGTDYGTFRYWPDTMKPSGGSGPPSAWTWQEVLADLWALLPSSLAGSCPSLPWNPTHDAYNLTFRGWPVWEAIAAVLECCQSTLTMQPSGVFSAVLLGSSQYSLNFSSLDSKKVLDWAPKTNVVRTRIPEKFRICFPVRGRDSKTTAVSHRWHDQRFHTVDVASGVSGAEPGTIDPVIAPLSAEMDIDGTTCLNSSECSSAAAALAAKCADRIKVLGLSDWKCFYGLQSTPSVGSQVHLIRWRDFGDGTGARTEYVTDASWSAPPRIPRVNIEHFNEAHLMARTCERYGYTYPSYISPVRGDRRLPISYQRYTVDSYGGLTWTDFQDSADADAVAISPPGWFPPRVKVELTHDQSRWRVSGWPEHLYVVPVAAIDAQTCTLTGGYGDTPRYTPGRGDARVYIYDPVTRDYVLQLYNDNTPVVVEIVNTSCEDTGTDSLIAHLNRDEEWTVEDRAAADDLKPRTLKAYDCINLGDTDSTAKVQRKNADDEWEDDPDYPDPVTVDNELCRAYAAKGWTFLALPPSAGSAGGCNCGSSSSSVPPPSPKWIPLGPAGPIIVRVTASVDCGATGTGKVLKTSCTSTCSETLPEEGNQCTVTFCNKTGRAIAAESTGEDEEKYEDVTLDAVGCCWYAQEKRRPQKIRFKFTGKMCAGATANISDVKFVDVCDWPWKPESAENPFNRQACDGDEGEATWNEQDKNYYVTAVTKHAKDVVAKVYMTDCNLYQDVIVSASMEGCNKGVCESPDHRAITPPKMDPKTLYESYTTCDGTYLTEHRRSSTVSQDGWCITITQGSWQDSPAGCCDCPSSPPPPPSSVPPSSSVPPPSDSVPPSSVPPSDSVPPSSVPPSSVPPCGGVCMWVAVEDSSPPPPVLHVTCRSDANDDGAIGIDFDWGTPIPGQMSYAAVVTDSNGNVVWSSGCIGIGPDTTSQSTASDVLPAGGPYTMTMEFFGEAGCGGSAISSLSADFNCEVCTGTCRWVSGYVPTTGLAYRIEALCSGSIYIDFWTVPEGAVNFKIRILDSDGNLLNQTGTEAIFGASNFDMPYMNTAGTDYTFELTLYDSEGNVVGTETRTIHCDTVDPPRPMQWFLDMADDGAYVNCMGPDGVCNCVPPTDPPTTLNEHVTTNCGSVPPPSSVPPSSSSSPSSPPPSSVPCSLGQLEMGSVTLLADYPDCGLNLSKLVTHLAMYPGGAQSFDWEVIDDTDNHTVAFSDCESTYSYNTGNFTVRYIPKVIPGRSYRIVVRAWESPSCGDRLLCTSITHVIAAVA